MGKRRGKPERGDSPKCLFCGTEGNLTREDAWPEWLLDLFTLEHGRTGTEWRFSKERYYEERILVPHRPPRLRRKIVCKPCNEGWMSGLEQAAKPILAPMIVGETRELSMADQKIIGAWAVKTGITLNLMGRGERFVEPQEARTFLYEQGEPSPDFRVYANSPRGPGFSLFHEHVAVAWPRPDGVTSSRPDGHWHWIMAGDVLFQVVAGYREDKAPPAEVRGEEHFDRIWPTRDRLQWPSKTGPRVTTPEPEAR